ncbi:MAG: HD domain-containing phosphohydrolase [Elusimicrobiota bacterium]
MTGQPAKKLGVIPAEADIDATGLFEIAEEIASSVDLDTVLKKIGLVAKKLLNCEASAIMLFDESRKNLYFKVATGEKSQAVQKIIVPVGVGIAGWVAKNLSPVIIEDTSKDQRFTGQFDKTSGFVTKSLICVAMFSKGEPLGIMEVLNKSDGTFSGRDLGLLTNLAGLASIAISNAQLIQRQRNFFAHSLDILALAIESLGGPYLGHPWRSQYLAMMLGRHLGLAQSDLANLMHGSLLHDIGALGINNSRYLESLGLPLNTSSSDAGAGEALHASVGAMMLEGIEMFRGAIAIIRHHHERYDGAGFPDKLKGNDIPMGARILAVVEVIEDLRHQLRGMNPDELKRQMITEISNLNGKNLDPVVCQAFLDVAQDEFANWK